MQVLVLGGSGQIGTIALRSTNTLVLNLWGRNAGSFLVQYFKRCFRDVSVATTAGPQNLDYARSLVRPHIPIAYYRGKH